MKTIKEVLEHRENLIKAIQQTESSLINTDDYNGWHDLWKMKVRLSTINWILDFHETDYTIY